MGLKRACPAQYIREEAVGEDRQVYEKVYCGRRDRRGPAGIREGILWSERSERTGRYTRRYTAVGEVGEDRQVYEKVYCGRRGRRGPAGIREGILRSERTGRYTRRYTAVGEDRRFRPRVAGRWEGERRKATWVLVHPKLLLEDQWLQ
eukprot:1178506-Prorocentrum_minimum.AAC.2